MSDRRWDKSKPPTGPWALNRDCPQGDGLVAWYPMGGAASANFAPSYANEAVAAAVGVGTPTMTLGRDGQPMVVLNGSSQYLTVAHSALLNSPDFSVSARVSGTYPNAYGTIVHKGNNSYFFEVYIKSNGKLATYILAGGPSATASYYDGTGSATLADNVEYNVALSYTGSSRVIVPYVDGVVDATPTVGAAGSPPDNFASNTFDLHIGNDRYTAGRQLGAAVCDVRYYNAVLSADVVRSISSPGTRYELWYPLRSRKWMSLPSSGFQAAWARQQSRVIGAGAR